MSVLELLDASKFKIKLAHNGVDIFKGCVEAVSGSWDTSYQLRAGDCDLDDGEKIVLWGATKGTIQFNRLKLTAFDSLPAEAVDLTLSSDIMNLTLTVTTPGVSPNNVWTMAIPNCAYMGETIGLQALQDALYFLEGAQFEIYQDNPIGACA